MKQNAMVTDWNSWNAMSTETQLQIMKKFLAKIIRMTDEKAHEKYYKENGGIIEVVMKRGVGHHPHCLPDNTPIIEFIEKYYV